MKVTPNETRALMSLNAERDRYYKLLEKLDARFGGAIDEDLEINGGDAVEWITEFIVNEVRPAIY